MAKNENYDPEIYVIPVNISDNGYAVWIIKKKNLIEAIVLGAAFFLLWKLIFSPFSYIVRIASFCFTVLPVIILALTGVREESLLEFLIEYFFYIKKRRRMTFRIPREVQERKTRRLFQKKEEDTKPASPEETPKAKKEKKPKKQKPKKPKKKKTGPEDI